VLLKNIFDKTILSILLLTALGSRATDHPHYGRVSRYFDIDPATRAIAIHDLSASHYKKPLDISLINQLAEVYTADGQIDSALRYWALLAEREPDDDTALYAQAQLYYSIDSIDRAAVMAQKAAALQPSQIGYLTLMAMIEYRLDSKDSALSLCYRVLSQSSTNVNALLLSGIILRDQNKNAAALDMFDRCLKADPANTEALVHRADGYVLLKKYNDALRDYSAARADLSDNADILNNIGICYYASGAYKQAIFFFKKAIQIDHLHPQSYFNRGIAYYHMNDPDTAADDIKKASAIWDTSIISGCHILFRYVL
jgi:tetratricopeptide (TPR) repeat protein